MKLDFKSQVYGLLLIFTLLLLLSACAPTVSSPSVALRQQLETIMQQQQQQAEQLQAMQEQLAQLQRQATGPLISPPTQVTEPPAATDEEKVPAYVTTELSDNADSASTYLTAFSQFTAGRFASAEAGFKLFLDEYPEHQYAPNARYWLASSQAAQYNLQSAMSNLRQIILDNNGQAKAPSALVLLAKLYRQQDLDIEADDVLEQLRHRYPDSSEAQHFYQSDEPLGGTTLNSD